MEEVEQVEQILHGFERGEISVAEALVSLKSLKEKGVPGAAAVFRAIDRGHIHRGFLKRNRW